MQNEVLALVEQYLDPEFPSKIMNFMMKLQEERESRRSAKL
jgi:hypothetical protein